MLIISSLLLVVPFLTQVAVLAAPIPLNGLSLDARADDDALFSRARKPQPRPLVVKNPDPPSPVSSMLIH